MRQLIEILINQIPFVHDNAWIAAIIFFGTLGGILLYLEISNKYF